MAILSVFAGIVAILIPSAIVALIVTAAINKEKGNDVEKFTSNVRTVYAYIIVIATLFMIISGTIVGVNSLLDYFLPESELESISNDCMDNYSYRYCNATTKELRVRNEKNAGMQGFAGALAVVIVATPLFISYSKEVKNSLDNVSKEKTVEAKKEVKTK